MNRLALIFSIITLNLNLLFPQHLLTVAELCSPFSCNHHANDPIQFPFSVPENQTTRCGFPGFDLSCNSDGQTLFPLGEAGHLIVGEISYMDQILLVSDPNQCIPKRVIELNHRWPSSFRFYPYESPYTFLNCSRTNGTTLEMSMLPGDTSIVSCMSGGNYTVVAAFDSTAEEKMLERGREWKCEMIERVNVAFWGPGMQYEYDYDRHGYYPMDLSNVFVQLGWDIPGCGDCMVRGGSCGLVGDSGLEVACYIPASSSSGLPKSAKYGLILGAGIPGLVCIVGLTFYTSSRVSARRNQTRRYTNTESSPSIFPQPIILTLGLDLPTIESYPKTILGESKRLPKPSDNICPICLSEYQPKEALRSIPECNHYFHADCIDEWLRMNATCPLCRNSPQSSSGVAGSGR
ncbi:RING-H2 finger protein ATL20-like [Spinacia oleracea]|uniref:RING-type E3 ubiquitin transferase n=1 Tax=Spinacia oleracea TaxID=3562 RepID=A0A9R0JTL5_SPIOL|nr:RING-H2 finger protein ATL20-like [Spinacia oleracea]